MVDALKTIIETLFRLLPFPTETGLRIVGNPGPNAPVFVTCNYDLTVRRVIKSLAGMDCFLLVAPSKGIRIATTMYLVNFSGIPRDSFCCPQANGDYVSNFSRILQYITDKSSSAFTSTHSSTW